MGEKIREIRFVGAKTRGEQLAIQTCPWYDGTVKRALDDPDENSYISYYAGGCPQKYFCKVYMYSIPEHGKLIVTGRCRMRNKVSWLKPQETGEDADKKAQDALQQ